MKATIEFELPDDAMQLERCLKVNELDLAVHDFYYDLRNREKHSDTIPEDWQEVIDLLIQHLHNNDVRLL